jgi:hypothetical protein
VSAWFILWFQLCCGYKKVMLEQNHEIKAQFRLMQAIQALLVAGVFLPQARAFFS